MPIRAEEAILRPVTSFLFKGKNGTGKTILATGQEFRPVYVFNCEGRIESALRYHSQHSNLKDFDYDNFPIGSGYYHIDKRMDELVKSCPYKTVVMSSLTSFIYLILEHLIRDKFGKKTAKGFDAGKKIGGIPVNELQDFNAEDSAIINDLVAAFQQLKDIQGVTCILEAHITPYEIVSLEEGQRTTTTVNNILTKGKKAPASIPAFFNEIWLFQKEFASGLGKKEAKYLVNTSGTPTDDCKTSWGIESFDWTDKDGSVEVFNQLRGNVEGEKLLSTPRVDPNAPKVVTFK